MKSTREMISLNRKQALFYDSIHDAEKDRGHGGYAENQSANCLTRAWAQLRYRQQEAVRLAGVEQRMAAAHRRWIRARAGLDFLELGCFSGSPSTFELASAAGRYLGVDLSPLAVEALNGKFAAKGLSDKASACAIDFLEMGDSRKFDLIYAHGVLHHFENPGPLFEKLAALCNPGAELLFVEPCAVNPLFGMIRAAYRPFQSDAPWEWPFRRRTVRLLEQHFDAVEGFGWGRNSLPISVFTGLPVIGRLVMPWYLAAIEREVTQGWYSGVWNNSMVTALFRRRDTGV